MKTYSIVRRYFKGEREIIAEGLSLEDAQEHCEDPETSSSTCTGEEGLERTSQCGMWFDSYTEE
jgi:hypothetical protein